MRIMAGFRIGFSCPQETPILLALRTHPSRRHDLLSAEDLVFDPDLPSRNYPDSFGNLCTRIVAPAGDILVHTEFLVRDSGLPDPVVPDARQHPIEELPDDVLVYLLWIAVWCALIGLLTRFLGSGERRAGTGPHQSPS